MTITAPRQTAVASPPTRRRRRGIPDSAGQALVWLLAQGQDIAPIPGTRRVARVEENTAADGIELNQDQLTRLGNLTPAVGARHDEANMASIDR